MSQTECSEATIALDKPEPIKEIEVAQRSEQWFKDRLGKVTASRIGDILNTIRNGNWAASRKNYAAQLVTERLSPERIPEAFTNEAMQWGVDQEPHARAAYEARTGNKVTEVGFCDHPTIAMAGASPDGFVGDDGLLEIKCPTTATHIETLLAGQIPEKHKYQMLWQMACTKRTWCDFVSFDPRLPEEMQVFLERFHGDPAEITRIEKEVMIFNEEVDATVDALTKKFSSRSKE